MMRVCVVSHVSLLWNMQEIDIHVYILLKPSDENMEHAEDGGGPAISYTGYLPNTNIF